MSNKKSTGSYLQGVSSLIVDATLGITDLTETMHKRIVHPPFLPSTPIQNTITNIAGFTFKNIKWSTKLIGKGLNNLLVKLTPFLGELKTSDKKEAILSVLNGVIGDYLVEKRNPLQIKMEFRHLAKPIIINPKSLVDTYPKINGKILLMVHGSCMNDIQWTQKKHNHGTSISKGLHKTPVYLNYNSGLHVSQNGKELNLLLEELVLQWPVPVEEINIVSHSMGGLVSRSALYYGLQQKKTWTAHIKKIVFLGTPHHGAPLERIGNYIDVILEAIPYAKPFARLGKIRSAGVTDLRYGNLVDEDWLNKDRFKLQRDKRQNIPLPKNVECYSIAGSVGREANLLSTKIMGDNMVEVKSALGIHKKPSKNLNFKKENTFIVYENTHVDLLSNSKIDLKLKEWLV
jgi:pimeloyl-ACP methyl ester carboxylesterase